MRLPFAILGAIAATNAGEVAVNAIVPADTIGANLGINVPLTVIIGFLVKIILDLRTFSAVSKSRHDAQEKRIDALEAGLSRLSGPPPVRAPERLAET